MTQARAHQRAAPLTGRDGGSRTHARQQYLSSTRTGKDQGKEAFIRQDPAIGDVILSRKPDSWDGFFKRLPSAEVPEDFLVDRSDAPPQARELF